MPCNPCCCWKLKDAAVTIGIWSTIYALASLAMFTWQWGVLSQCRHVTMAQSNLQCEYYCPCVGASTARTSVIIEGLFVIQILCLISSFFLLFSSIMLIYGVHTWSRYLVWPWFICMASSILTSLAYCIMWWAGDVRDYWLVLTILEAFGVFLNCYCFVVICVFYKNMLIELEYYEGKRAAKYNRFSQRDTPQHIIEQDMDGNDDHQGGSHLDYRYPRDGWEGEWRGANYPITDTKYPPDPMLNHYPQHQQQYPQQYTQQKSPYFPQKFDHTMVPRDPMLSAINEPLDPIHERSRSAIPPAQPSVFEDFKDVPRQEHRRSHRHRSSCRHCEPRKHKNHRRRSHGHHHHKSYYSSDACSTEGTESTGSRLHHHHHHRHRSSSHRHEGKSLRRQQSDNESDLISDSTADPNYQGRASKRHKSVGDSKGFRQVKSEAKERQHKCATMQSGDNEQDVNSNQVPTASYPPSTPGGITIPQHIVIPPALDSSAERKYHINSEITISYDPRAQGHDRQTGVLSPANHPGSPVSSTQGRRVAGMAQTPVSITSNV